jgi:hypothetical protein
LYWIFSPLFSTYSLLIIQWLCILTGAWSTYKLILLKSANTVLATGAMVYFLVLYGRFSAYQNDCNLVLIGSAIIPLLLLFFEQRKFVPFVLLFIILSFNREDFPLGLFFIGIFLMITGNDRHQKKLAAFMCVASIVFFVVIFKFLIPFLEDENKKYSLFNYSALGSSPFEVLKFVLLHPLTTTKMLFVNHISNPEFDGVKYTFYLIYFIGGGFVLFFRPVYFIPLVPLIAKRMLNDDPVRWSHEAYHSVEIVSLLPVLVFSVIGKIRSSLWNGLAGVAVCLITICTTVYWLQSTRQAWDGYNKFNFLRASFFYDEKVIRDAHTGLKKIPPEARVSASGKILPHLAFRPGIYHFPQLGDAEYIYIFRKYDIFPLMPDDFEAHVQKVLADPAWTIEYQTDDLLLLHHR